MRHLFTFLFTLIALQFSLAQKVTPKPLDCSIEMQGNTYWISNEFNNYPCLPAGSNAYNGNEVVYKFGLSEVTDVRFTYESTCPIGLFLLDSDMNCIEYSELDPGEFGVTESFLGAIRLLPDSFFLVVDRPVGLTCDNFTLFMDCTPYKPYTICELGGDVTSCNHTVTDTLPGTPSSPAPPEGNPSFDIQSLEVPIDPCEPTESFRIYQAYFDNPVTVNAQLLNAPPTAKVLIYTDECACLSDYLCFDGGDCGESGGFSDNGILNNAPSGFYYFVVIGAAADTYDLKVVTNDCMCDYEAEPISCGDKVTADAATETNKFDNVPGRGINAYDDCYGRDRPYTGGDKVYEFEIFEQSKVTIKLTSFFNAGLFVFDANCATDCLGVGETFGINGETTIEELHLQRGVYQIVVDLEKEHAASCPFMLEIVECEPVPQYQVAFIDETEIIHEMDIVEEMVYNRQGNKLVTGRNAQIAFFANNPECDNVGVNGPVPVTSARVENYPLFGKEDEDAPTKAYVINENFKMVLSINDTVQGFVQGAIGQVKTFNGGIESTLTRVSSITADNGVVQAINVSPIDQNLSVDGGMATFEIFTNDSSNPRRNLDWCVAELEEAMAAAKIDIISIRPTKTGRGKETIIIEYGPNPDFEEKRCTVRIAGTTINRDNELIFRQLGNICINEKVMPFINKDTTLTVSNTISEFELRQLFEPKTEIVSDNCTSNENLRFFYPNRLTFPLTVGSHQLYFEVKDEVGNDNRHSLPIEVFDPTMRVGNITNPIGFVEGQTIDLDPINIIPNPNNGQFDIQISPITEGVHQLVILNTLGQTIKKYNQYLSKGPQKIEVNMRSFTPGIYMVQLRAGQKTHNKKMVISNL